jgi:myo-inositol-1(or 4)-monophosphatase
MDETEARTIAERAARIGGEIAMERFRSDLLVEHKSETLDAVTAADREAQEAVIEHIDPDAAVVAEEDDAAKTMPDGPAWVIDPIDGTNNYAVGNPDWATSVAYAVDGEARVGVTQLPAVGDTYATVADGVERNGERVTSSERTAASRLTVSAIFGLQSKHRRAYRAVTSAIIDAFGDLRRGGSGQIALARVAAGELDAAVSTVALDPWDTLAGVAMVRAAGGRVTTLDGDPWRHDSAGLVATNGVAHETVREVVVEAVGE